MLFRAKKINFITLPMNRVLPSGKSLIRFKSKDANVFDTAEEYKNVIGDGKDLPKNIFREKDLIEYIKSTPQFARNKIVIVKSKEEIENEKRAIAIAEFVADQREDVSTGLVNLSVLEKLELEQLKKYAVRLGVSLSAADGAVSKPRTAEAIVADINKLLKPSTNKQTK